MGWVKVESIYFSQFWSLGSLSSTCQQGRFYSEASSLGLQASTISLCAYMTSLCACRGKSKLSGVCFIRTPVLMNQGPTFRTLFNLITFLQILYINIVTLGVRASTYKFWEAQFSPQNSPMGTYTDTIIVRLESFGWFLQYSGSKSDVWVKLIKSHCFSLISLLW